MYIYVYMYICTVGIYIVCMCIYIETIYIKRESERERDVLPQAAPPSSTGALGAPLAQAALRAPSTPCCTNHKYSTRHAKHTQYTYKVLVTTQV